MRTKWTTIEDRFVVELHEQGFSAPKIAELLNRGRTTENRRSAHAVKMRIVRLREVGRAPERVVVERETGPDFVERIRRVHELAGLLY
jgi:hypothetical protein